MKRFGVLVYALARCVSVTDAEEPTSCERPDGTSAPCGPGNDQCHAPGYGRAAPQFHVHDASCGMNDPVAPVYDPAHGVYHTHWEAHLAMPGGQYVNGHAVSRDLTFWARMPVSLWNDRAYDAWAIFTGSATVVDGLGVARVYPGLCEEPAAGTACPGATNLCVAVPADPADPLQTNWTKEGAGFDNPVVNDTARDPSTAWRTPAGEWRLVTYGSEIFASADFARWYRVGVQPAFPVGECPSFYPLPATTPGAGPPPAGAGTPTHVYKVSRDGHDVAMVGTYAAGEPARPDNFSATPGVPFALALVDAGVAYASKDFYDPVGARRVSWAWARVSFGPWSADAWDSSCHTLAREVTWHPELQQLVFSPLAEQAALRGRVVGALGARAALPDGRAVALGLPAGVGDQSELVVSFVRPAAAANLSVRVMADASGGGGAEFVVEYAPPAAGGPSVSEVIVGCPTINASARLRLSPSDTTIDVRVFSDRALAEAYWMNGRVAMTVPAACDRECDMSVRADGAEVGLVSATAWKVRSMWISKEEVLRTPRLDMA